MASSTAPSPASQDKDTLSLPATLLYRLGLPLTISTLYVYSPATALFTPLVAAPTAILLYQRSSISSEKRPAKLETLTWTFLGAATIAPVLSMVAQGVLSYATALLVFRSETSEYIKEFTRSAHEVRALPLELVGERAAMAQSWPYLAYLTFFSFFLAGLPEESVKFGILRLIERYTTTRLTAGDYIVYARAIGLGFSFFENLGFIYASAKGDSMNMLFVTAAERILYGTAAHVLTSVLTGIRMAKSSSADAEKDDSPRTEKASYWLRTILPSTLYHGAGDALLLAACAWDGHPGWVHPETVGSFLKYLVGPVTLMTGLALQVKREMLSLGVGWTGI